MDGNNEWLLSTIGVITWWFIFYFRWQKPEDFVICWIWKLYRKEEQWYGFYEYCWGDGVDRDISSWTVNIQQFTFFNSANKIFFLKFMEIYKAAKLFTYFIHVNNSSTQKTTHILKVWIWKSNCSKWVRLHLIKSIWNFFTNETFSPSANWRISLGRNSSRTEKI